MTLDQLGKQNCTCAKKRQAKRLREVRKDPFHTMEGQLCQKGKIKEKNKSDKKSFLYNKNALVPMP